MSRPSVITFTPATDPSDLWKDGQQQSQPEELEPTLDGAAARAFYEALIGDESSTPEPQRLQPEPASERKRKKRRMMRETATGSSGGHGQRRSLEAEDKMTHWILRAAQEGDLAELRRLLDPHEAGGAGGNINARDAFWWTPLMCAARAGQGAAVRYLLDQGAAWVGVCELGGRDAAQLAEEAGFPEVACIVRESRGEKRSPENRSQASSPQYCETCDAHFQDSNHRTSTAHLLSLSQDLQTPSLHLGVPMSSPGFKLLLKGGWEPGMGLGPQGKGRVNPIPTVLKRDQEGLGYRSFCGEAKQAWEDMQVPPEPEGAAPLGDMMRSPPCYSGSLLGLTPCREHPTYSFNPQPGTAQLYANLTSPRDCLPDHFS